MEISSDFKDLLREFSSAKVKYLIVGAHAVGYHGRPRGTGDFDVWVEPSSDNAERVFRALALFGAPMDRIAVSDFMRDDLIFQIGIVPIRIDIITDITGVLFDEAWPNRVDDFLEGIPVSIIGRDDLIKNKRATGRHKDLADVEELLL